MCSRLPLELTLVSRRVRSETLDFLLGTNLFIVRARDLAFEPFPDFCILSSVPTAHLTRMANLVVRLNCWPCPWGHDPTSYSQELGGRHPVPFRCGFCDTVVAGDHAALSASSPAGLRLFEGWEDLCRRLGSRRKPGQTSLTVICDIDGSDDGQTSSLVTGPLTKYLPLLRSCTIRLGRSPSYTNSVKMARDTALYMMGCKVKLPPAAKPFPFKKLPRELKLAVLRYTHLGPPEPAGYDDDFDRVEIMNGRLLRGTSIDATSRFVRTCCSKCTETQLDWSVSPPITLKCIHTCLGTYLRRELTFAKLLHQQLRLLLSHLHLPRPSSLSLPRRPRNPLHRHRNLLLHRALHPPPR